MFGQQETVGPFEKLHSDEAEARPQIPGSMAEMPSFSLQGRAGHSPPHVGATQSLEALATSVTAEGHGVLSNRLQTLEINRNFAWSCFWSRAFSALTARCRAPRWLKALVSSVRTRPLPGVCAKLRAMIGRSSGSRHASATAVFTASCTFASACAFTIKPQVFLTSRTVSGGH